MTDLQTRKALPGHLPSVLIPLLLMPAAVGGCGELDFDVLAFTAADEQGAPSPEDPAQSDPASVADIGSGSESNTGSTTDQDDGDAPLGEEDVPQRECVAQVRDARLVHEDDGTLLMRDPECGKLSYGLYANHGQTERRNILPDFSYAGYEKGGVPIPEGVPVVLTLDPGTGDRRADIQNAIDNVSAREPDDAGFRGAVLLTAGRYEVSDTLTIKATGVVLRGAGQSRDGTVLVATKRSQHSLIEISGSGSGLAEVSGTRVRITTAVVPVGATSFDVQSAAGFAVGDTIGVLRTPNQTWIDDLQMQQWGWTTESYTIAHERQVVAIHDNTIHVDIPIVDTMEEQYGGGAVFLADVSGRIERCGVEDIRLVSEYADSDDEDHGWNAVKLSRVANSWVRRMTAAHFGYAAVTLHNAASFNTIEEVAQLDPVSQVTGGRRYSFNVSGGVGNLFQRCFATDGRHNFVTGSRGTGPHVWLDCLSVQNNSDEGPHHRWSTGLLFDNIRSASVHVQNRESSGTGHGWAGAQTLFWNVEATQGIICDTPLGAMNWSVGSVGAQREGSWAPEAPAGTWISHGVKVLPRSLYLAQLEDRLGPAAVDAVTIPQQRDGPIHALLNNWAGERPLADVPSDDVVGGSGVCDGILSGQACCPSSCGECGGTGCSGRPGGADSCCVGRIMDAGLSCATNLPPCVMP